jgi:SRR1
MARRFADEFNIEYAFLPIVVEPQPIQLHSVTNEYIPQYPIFPFETVQAIFQRMRTEWEASSVCQQLMSTLRSAALPDVKKIVAFACFNMSDCMMAERSACQHALILILRDFFAKRQHIVEEDILCFAQDPLYENVDKRVLVDAGISVAENPRAFLEVDGTSLVLSISPETAVRQIVADIAQPAVMIWNRVQEIQRSPDWVGQTEWYGPCHGNVLL